MVIHPDEGVEMAGNKITGTRENAEFYAHCMIERRLKRKIKAKKNRAR